MTAKAYDFKPWLQDLIDNPPQRGEGFTNWVRDVAKNITNHRGFGQDEAKIEAFIREKATGIHVSRSREYTRNIQWGMAHAVLQKNMDLPPAERAKATPVPIIHKPSLPDWPGLDREGRDWVIKMSPVSTLEQLQSFSPITINGDSPDTEQIIDWLFPGNPLLSCGPKANYSVTRNREVWRGRLSKLSFIVPSPLIARIGETQDKDEITGKLKLSERALSIVGPRRYLVVEFDNKGETKDRQAALISHLAGLAPLVGVWFSGGKSLHAWFDCKGIPDSQLYHFMRLARSWGADLTSWTRNQLERMPGGTRYDEDGNFVARQTVHYLNPQLVPVEMFATDWQDAAFLPLRLSLYTGNAEDADKLGLHSPFNVPAATREPEPPEFDPDYDPISDLIRQRTPASEPEELRKMQRWLFKSLSASPESIKLLEESQNKHPMPDQHFDFLIASGDVTIIPEWSKFRYAARGCPAPCFAFVYDTGLQAVWKDDAGPHAIFAMGAACLWRRSVICEGAPVHIYGSPARLLNGLALFETMRTLLIWIGVAPHLLTGISIMESAAATALPWPAYVLSGAELGLMRGENVILHPGAHHLEATLDGIAQTVEVLS